MGLTVISPRVVDDCAGLEGIAQAVYLTLALRDPQGSVPGLIQEGVATIADRMRRDPTEIVAALQQLGRADIVRYDHPARLIQLPRLPMHTYPASSPGANHVIGWFRSWRTLPDSPLRTDHVPRLRAICNLRDSKVAEAWNATFDAETRPISAPSTGSLSLFSLAGSPPLGDPLKSENRQISTFSNSSPIPPSSSLDGRGSGSPMDLILIRSTSPDPDPEARTRPAARRVMKGAGVLARWREVCLRLWALQEKLRQEAAPGLRSRPPLDDRLLRIAELLDRGHTEDECQAVLRGYAAEARARGDAQWFDGVTNWRPENFERQLGRCKDPAARAGALPPAVAADYEKLAREYDERKARPTPARPLPAVTGLADLLNDKNGKAGA